MSTCGDVELWKCLDVELSSCGDVQMWSCADVAI